MLLPALWAGLLVCIGAIAAPAAFATLAPPEAGRVVARLFAQEAYLSLVMAIALFLMERGVARVDAEAGKGSIFSANLVLLLATLFCTVAGYFALQPMLAAARAGQAGMSFAVLHGVSAGLFILKAALVCALAWRVAKPA
ncbi:DUF4149 domain-containing protein [Ideonella sp. BN130291]|uniref:DUF4149 domain-containing protein n=1 Tax=Ideonella sp. BN130291 TaxID=3112940 RepID=UPI002E25C3F6|nr:DUF4149 domain-containing protein [Ideonella sp. BN130291]